MAADKKYASKLKRNVKQTRADNAVLFKKNAGKAKSSVKKGTNK